MPSFVFTSEVKYKHTQNTTFYNDWKKMRMKNDRKQKHDFNLIR